MTEATTQTEQETHLGTITDETPLFRVFEFDPPLRDPGEGKEYAELTYTGTNDNLDVFCFAAAGETEEIAWPTEAWNRDVAPQVTGYRDTDGETAQAGRDDEPADTPAHRMTPEQGKAVLDLRLKVRLAEQEEKEAKEVHDSKKKRVKSLQDQLNSMLDDIERGQLTLFNQAEAEPEPEEKTEPAGIGPEADKLPVGAKVEIDVEWTVENDWLREAQYVGMSGSPDDPALRSLMFGYEGVGGEEEGEIEFPEYISPKEWDELYAPHVISITGEDGEVLWKRESPDQEDLTEDERAMRLHRIHISPAIITKLAENEPRILSLGDLVDWQREKGDFWAKDITGIGPKAREEIENALMRFWEQRGKKE